MTVSETGGRERRSEASKGRREGRREDGWEGKADWKYGLIYINRKKGKEGENSLREGERKRDTKKIE